MKEQNMLIVSADVTFERDTFLTCHLRLEGNGAGVGFGGWSLCTYDKEKGCRVGTAFGAEYLRQLLTTLGATSLTGLVGKVVRTRWKGDGKWGDTLVAVGHPIEDKWFNPRELAEAMLPERKVVEQING